MQDTDIKNPYGDFCRLEIITIAELIAIWAMAAFCMAKLN